MTKKYGIKDVVDVIFFDKDTGKEISLLNNVQFISSETEKEDDKDE